MKFFAYLSMSTLIGTTTAASSALRGSDGEALAPPRVFNEPHATMETSTGELTSSKWIEGNKTVLRRSDSQKTEKIYRASANQS